MKTVRKVKGVRKTKKARVTRLARLSNVTPVAIKSKTDPSKATIPIAIQTTGNSSEAKALIPVEVKTAGGASVKRAALVPIAVKNASKSRTARKNRHAGPARKSARNVVRKAVRPLIVHHEMKRKPMQKDLLTRSVLTVAKAEETAVNLAGQLSLTLLDIAPKWLQVRFGAPVRFATVSDRV